MTVLSLLSTSGLKAASFVMRQLGGISHGDGIGRSLFSGAILGVIHSICWSVTLAVSVWIGARVHPKVIRNGSRMLLDFRTADLSDSEVVRHGIREIIGGMTFFQCLADLSIGTAWTATVVGVPIITVLIVIGRIGGAVANKMSWYFVPPVFATLLVVVTTPLLLLGFRLIRGLLKLAAHREPAAV
jgi:hypothetical protein